MLDDNVQALAWIGTIPYDIAQAYNAINLAQADIGHHGCECLQVPMNVAN